MGDHLRLHNGLRPHSCHLCPKRFARRNTLDRHVSAVHRQREYKFSCDHCHRQFRHPSHYREHLKREHSTKRPLEFQQETTSLSTADESRHPMVLPFDEFENKMDIVTESSYPVDSNFKMDFEETTAYYDEEVAQLSISQREEVGGQVVSSSSPKPKENSTPPLVEFDASPPSATTGTVAMKTQSIIQQGQHSKVQLTSSSLPFHHTSDGPFHPLKIFKDVSNKVASSQPKAILATVNGKQVILVPAQSASLATKTARDESNGGGGSKLEQCLRFGSASVANSTYINQFPVQEEEGSGVLADNMPVEATSPTAVPPLLLSPRVTNDSGFLEIRP